MGAGPSAAGAPKNDAYLTQNQRIRKLMTSSDLCMQTLIEHYQPPSFPIEPLVTNKTVDICRESWSVIKNQERKGVSGVVYFYDEFYKRLFDRSEAFNSFFSGDMKKKGMILIRIIEFLTTLDVEAKEIFAKRLEGLAKVHSKRTIRPWMYSVFIETLMTTISFCLEEKATFEVASAWTNLGAYVLRAMLPGAIKDTIVTTESNQNSFSGELDEEEILDLQSQEGDGAGGFTGRSSGRKSGRSTGRKTARESARGSRPNSARGESDAVASPGA